MERLTHRDDQGMARIGFGGLVPTAYESKAAIDRLAAYEDAMPLERVQALAQADRDGRLVVLPLVSSPVQLMCSAPYNERIAEAKYLTDVLAQELIIFGRLNKKTTDRLAELARQEAEAAVGEEVTT